MIAANKYTLMYGDCLERMKEIKAGSVDMVLCDLPYGVTQHKADIVIPLEPLWKEYKRIIKDDGCIALFAQGVFYIDLVRSNLAMFRYDLVWDKVLTTGFLNAKRMPLRCHEQIAIFYKHLPKYNPQFFRGEPLHSKGKSYISKEIKNQSYGQFHATDDARAGSTDKYPRSILRFAKPHPSVALHRTEKPVELLKYLIMTYTDENETVLDNCMGSGSTGVACAECNRSFIGIEKDKGYFDLSSERIKKAFEKAK